MDKNFEELLGKKIQDARNELGWWWVLKNQNVNIYGGKYYFVRVGANPNHIDIETNERNEVTKVKPYLSLNY